MRSKYVVFPEKGRVELREEDVASPGPGEILCGAEKSLISIGTESYCLEGRFDPGTNWERWVRYPFRPGYSMVARVIAVGSDVEGIKEGDRVAVSTSHQQFFRTRVRDAHVLPEGISDEDGTWMSLACTTQLGIRRAELQLGETVGVVGMGMLGQLVVQYLAASGARRIIAIDTIQSRLDMAMAHGATHALNAKVDEARAEIAAITDNKMLDVVYDVTGNPAVLAGAIPLVRRLGRLILLGDTPTPTQQHLAPGVLSNSIAILGIHGSTYPADESEFHPWTRRTMTDLFFDYLLRGRMRVADLISHRHAPSDAPEVYRRLLEDRSSALGVIFDWSL